MYVLKYLLSNFTKISKSSLEKFAWKALEGVSYFTKQLRVNSDDNMIEKPIIFENSTNIFLIEMRMCVIRHFYESSFAVMF